MNRQYQATAKCENEGSDSGSGSGSGENIEDLTGNTIDTERGALASGNKLLVSPGKTKKR